jgi:hypothetical protein
VSSKNTRAKRIIRIFLLVSLLPAVFLPAASEAQQPKKVPRIGYISTLSPSSDNRSEPFWQGLRELGYVEGQNITIAYRYTEGKVDRAAEYTNDSLIEGNQQRYVVRDNLGQNSFGGPICCAPPLSAINPARSSSRIDCSSRASAPLARRCERPARPCLKAFWFAGGPDFPRVPAVGMS